MIKRGTGKEMDAETRPPTPKCSCKVRKNPQRRGGADHGRSRGRSWKLVSLPFREEYPGGRQWNLDAAQFKIKPAELADDEVPHHPHWDMIFEHIGHELTPVLAGIALGRRCKPPNGGRLSSRLGGLRLPRSLPAARYLFFFGPEDSGKSISMNRCNG